MAIAGWRVTVRQTPFTGNALSELQVPRRGGPDGDDAPVGDLGHRGQRANVLQ
jgi:hypothetical protein